MKKQLDEYSFIHWDKNMSTCKKLYKIHWKFIGQIVIIYR